MVDSNSVHHQKEKTKHTMRLPETSQKPVSSSAASSAQSRGLDDSLRCGIHVKKDFVLNDKQHQILTLDGKSVIRGRRRQSPPLLPPPLPPSPRRHDDDDDDDEANEDGDGEGAVVGTGASSSALRGGCRSSCLREMNHLSLLSASKDLRVLLDLQYLTQAFRVLNSANQWSFNVFTLNKLTNGRSLFYMTLHIFNQSDFLRTFGLDVTRLMRCITLIESSYYFSNPYHNSVHAADVVQAMFCHLNEPKMAHCLKPLEKMAAILSAACHDVDHPGTNQGFLIATANPLCSLYDNTSILENHHWRATIGILHESKLFEHLDRQTWQTMKRLIQTMILATDITRQTEILSVFREHIGNNSLNLSSSEQHRSFILQITLKCADISNPCRPWHLSKCWSELICEEFFKQGECERSLGLPVTPFCDRSQSTMATIQAGFMTHVAEPLFIEWNRFSATTNSRTLLDNLQHNRGQWEDMTRREEKSPVPPNIALTETKSETREQTTQVDGECPENGRHDAADPSDADADSSAAEAGRSFGRRHSLPVGTGPLLLLLRGRSAGRRLSLPTGCHPSSLSSVISRLTRLSESSHASEDAGDAVRKSKMRRCSFEESRPPQTMSRMRRGSFEDNRSWKTMPISGRQHQMNQQRGPENNQKSQRLCNGLENNRSVHTMEEMDFFTDKKRLGDDALPCYMPNACQWEESERSGSNRWQMARKMSLIAPRDQQLMTVIVGRKRSRSLVTSTLVCTLEENGKTGGGGEGGIGGGGVLEANLLNGLIQTEQQSSSWGRWMAWWQRRATKNDFCQLPPGPPPLLNPDAYHCHLPGDGDMVEKKTLPPAAAQFSSVQLLRCECPVLVTRLVDSHCRSTKGGCSSSSSISRKPTSLFTSSSSPAREDAEAMPLLASDSACIWSNEM